MPHCIVCLPLDHLHICYYLHNLPVSLKKIRIKTKYTWVVSGGELCSVVFFLVCFPSQIFDNCNKEKRYMLPYLLFVLDLPVQNLQVGRER